MCASVAFFSCCAVGFFFLLLLSFFLLSFLFFKPLSPTYIHIGWCRGTRTTERGVFYDVLSLRHTQTKMKRNLNQRPTHTQTITPYRKKRREKKWKRRKWKIATILCHALDTEDMWQKKKTQGNHEIDPYCSAQNDQQTTQLHRNSRATRQRRKN